MKAKRKGEHRYRKAYGVWGGNPKGHAPNYERCAADVHTGWHFNQCSRKRGHGPDGAYCKQHAKRFEGLE